MKTRKQNADKKHIALYLGGLRKGGAERVISILADDLYERGWKVTLVTTFFTPPEFVPLHAAWNPDTGEDIPDMTGIHRVYSEPGQEKLSGSRVRNFIIRCSTLRSIWKEVSPDIILSFIGLNNIMAILTSLGLNIPVAISVRGMPAMEYYSGKLRLAADLLFPRAAGIILQTKQAQSFFAPRIQKKSVILPNPLNSDFNRPVYCGEREKRIICVGRLDENKDQSLLLRAFAQLCRSEDHKEGGKNITDGWTIHFYGDGPDREKLETEADEYGIGGRTFFEGTVSDIADRIGKAAVFVLPSRTEGMPNALMEAMAMGLACISTDCPCGGPSELIRDGENGFLVPVGDTEAMREKLGILMSDSSRRKTMGNKAADVQVKYCREAVSRQWEEYLSSLL